MRSVNWWDFEFDKVRVPALSTAGTPYHRNVAVGMPRIPPDILYSTFNLYHSVEDAKAGKRFGGTGFFVGYPTGIDDITLLYAVTNWHVAVRDGASVIRLNKIDGGFDILDFDPSEWEFRPGGPDLAVIPPALLDLKEAVHETVAIHLNMFVDRIKISTLKIGPGDDILLLGRFVDYDGGNQANIPSARFGNISIMPQKIPQPTGATELTSFVLDVHSRTGYSGSPVFVYRTLFSDLSDAPGNIAAGPHSHFINFLGVHWGQFPEQWEIESGVAMLPQGVSLSNDAKYISGFSGMTLVLPAWQLRDFLDMGKFVDGRNKAIQQIRAARGPNRGPVAESSAPPASDVNPNHREDFTRLVGAAAQKREQED